MTNGYTRSPKLLKGALVEFSKRFLGPIPNIIIFQYNPESLTRTLEVHDPEKAEKARKDAAANPGVPSASSSQSQPGDPPESFSLALELDAADALENPGSHPVAVLAGVADRIAALEMLLYPEPEKSLLGGLLGAVGASLSVGPGGISASLGGKAKLDKVPDHKVPVLLFVWGPGRIVPVRLTSFSVEEQAYSPLLYPIRAKVSVGMRILTPTSFPDPSGLSEKIAVKTFEFTRKQKEILAAANLANSVESILGMLPF